MTQQKETPVPDMSIGFDVREEFMATYKGQIMDVRLPGTLPRCPEINIKDGHMYIRACCDEHLKDAQPFLLALAEDLPRIMNFTFPVLPTPTGGKK